MDIQFIQQQHRDNIFKIMQLCGVDMAQAYQLYQHSNCNLQNAIQAKFNPVENVHNPYQYEKKVVQPSKLIHKVSEEEEYERYQTYRDNDLTFAHRYNIRKETGIISSLLSTFVKGSNQPNFKKKLQQQIQKRSALKVPNGSLSQCLQSVSKSKFPLLVHIIDFSSSPLKTNLNIRELYCNEQFIEMLNTQFSNYGIISGEYQLQEDLKRYLDTKNDRNSIIVLRVNAMEQVVRFQKIPFDGLTLTDVKKRLKKLKSQCINLQMDEVQYQKRYAKQSKGDYTYTKTMTIAQTRKLKQDRQIRKKQQQQFYAAVNKPKQQSSSASIGQKYQQKSKVEVVKVNKSQQQKAARTLLRSKLSVYSSESAKVLTIKLRLPSSQFLRISVSPNQPCQYLYDYVFSRQENLGFQDDQTRRLFDIIQPYDKINLSQRKHQLLGKVFEGQSMLSLVVNQILE